MGWQGVFSEHKHSSCSRFHNWCRSSWFLCQIIGNQSLKLKYKLLKPYAAWTPWPLWQSYEFPCANGVTLKCLVEISRLWMCSLGVFTLNSLSHQWNLLENYGYMLHRGEAMYISVIDFQWYCMKRKGFQWFSHSSFDYDYMHQLWNYIYYISTKIDYYCSILTCVIRATDPIRHCNIDYSGLEWRDINTFWYWCGKYIFIADAGYYNWMSNY